MAETLVASHTVANEINKLLSQLVDDVAGLQKAGDAHAVQAMKDKVKLIETLRRMLGATAL
jgi:hypothetical protein